VAASLYRSSWVSRGSIVSLWQREGHMRVATYNTRHGLPERATVIDSGGLAATVGRLDCDVVALQELDRGTRRVGGLDQPAHIATAIGAEVRFARAIDFDGGEYGIALASRTGFHRSEVLRLPGAGEPRVALLALVGPGARPGDRVGGDIAAPGGTGDVRDDRLGGWAVGSMHLSTAAGDALIQLRLVLRELDSFADGRPAVLLGDLNLGPLRVAPVMAAAGWVAAPSGPTHPAIRPRRRIDWVLARRASVIDSWVPNVLASDHRPLVADLIRGDQSVGRP